MDEAGTATGFPVEMLRNETGIMLHLQIESDANMVNRPVAGTKCKFQCRTIGQVISSARTVPQEKIRLFRQSETSVY